MTFPQKRRLPINVCVLCSYRIPVYNNDDLCASWYAYIVSTGMYEISFAINPVNMILLEILFQPR